MLLAVGNSSFFVRVEQVEVIALQHMRLNVELLGDRRDVSVNPLASDPARSFVQLKQCSSFVFCHVHFSSPVCGLGVSLNYGSSMTPFKLQCNTFFYYF